MEFARCGTFKFFLVSKFNKKTNRALLKRGDVARVEPEPSWGAPKLKNQVQLLHRCATVQTREVLFESIFASHFLGFVWSSF